ncbi:type II toxin-antitoxin system RelE/ParE family toxin [Legionella septentrionalis]|uniref:type II toxin-antitoxin system RelE/ParE family toxin n=1 Tax=Legionella septentrionalis TaxID=2498109 RepID=UPI000F8DA419|nr:type II toxin-antitoxin system YafQ family toxin [Legionella septentrionalis]RUQ92921.1 type II toxin-antitoxin system YafQ family toxin [Legionella septentrionalis]
MLSPFYKKQFEKDLRRIIKRGKDIQKIKDVIEKLINQTPLEPNYRDHALKGNYVDCRELHIEPDWLLIYLIQKNTITFVRTGSHADLFG